MERGVASGRRRLGCAFIFLLAWTDFLAQNTFPLFGGKAVRLFRVYSARRGDAHAGGAYDAFVRHYYAGNDINGIAGE